MKEKLTQLLCHDNVEKLSVQRTLAKLPKQIFHGSSGQTLRCTLAAVFLLQRPVSPAPCSQTASIADVDTKSRRPSGLFTALGSVIEKSSPLSQ